MRGASPRVAAHTLAGCGHDKFFTVSTQGAWRTHLTWLRAPARSKEGGRRRGGAHRCAAAVPGGSGGRGSRPRLGELLRSGWVLWDLPRKKGGLVRSGDGEPVAETGAEAAASLPVDGEVKARTRCTGGPSFIVASTGTDEAAWGGGLRSVVLRQRERACVQRGGQRQGIHVETTPKEFVHTLLGRVR
jgi:hypothetical protein